VEIDPLAVAAIRMNAASNGVQVLARMADIVGDLFRLL
jgi:predicted nicotinamide N-methyase